MALGSNYNQNNNLYKDKEVRSKYIYSNTESILDKSRLQPSFWNGMLKLSILPQKISATGEVTYDSDNSSSIYLTHIKARMLAEEIKIFLKDPNAYNNMGVNAGEGLLSISNGKEFGISGFFMVIRKINPESGAVEASIAYQFKTGFYNTIRNYVEQSSDHERMFYDNIEIDSFITLLEEYYKAVTNAMAYSVASVQRYDHNVVEQKINSIAEKLGVEIKGSSSTYKTSKSFFNRAGNDNIAAPTSFKTTSAEDIENQIG